MIEVVKMEIDGESLETAPAPSKETINTSGINSNYFNICNSDYLNVIKAGDING